MPPADTVIPCIAFTLVAELIFLSYRRFREPGNLASASERDERGLADATAYFRVMFVVGSVVKLSSHFAGVPVDVQKLFFPMLGIPLLVSALHYLRALWLVKRATKAEAS
ncbi:hypothetical protein [Hyphomicrobium sp.]|jgi:hypothetical protein|uniref:hypothetical protein n=1 Tax=Hyphomicrobium sp. TaxID=82 RepID=UPI00356773A0